MENELLLQILDEIKGVKQDIADLRAETKQDIAALRDELKQDISLLNERTLRTEQDIALLKELLINIERDITSLKQTTQRIDDDLSILKDIIIHVENDQARKIAALFDGFAISKDMNMFLKPDIEKLEAALADHDVKIKFLFASQNDEKHRANMERLIKSRESSSQSISALKGMLK